MPLNTRIDVTRPSAFTIRNHAFGIRPANSTQTATETGKTAAGALAKPRTSQQG